MGTPRMAKAGHSYYVGHTAVALPTLHLKVGPPAPHANASQSISDMLSVRAALFALSNDVAVSVPSESNGRPSAPQEASGVLSNLPRTRPQRSTPRRTAARKALATEAERDTQAASNGRATTSPTRAKARKVSAAPPRKPKPARKPRVRSAQPRTAAATPEREPVPLQGFESENDRARGPVHPPGGAELVASAIEVVGELAKSGLSTGERLLKDVLARLPLS